MKLCVTQHGCGELWGSVRMKRFVGQQFVEWGGAADCDFHCLMTQNRKYGDIISIDINIDVIFNII